MVLVSPIVVAAEKKLYFKNRSMLNKTLSMILFLADVQVKQHLQRLDRSFINNSNCIVVYLKDQV